MLRDENYSKIYYAVEGTNLQGSFPSKNFLGYESTVFGIRWADINYSRSVPDEVKLQVAVATMSTVLDLAVDHGILLKDRHPKNVLLAPVQTRGNSIVFRDNSGSMSIVQVDFDAVSYDFNHEYDLKTVLYDCICELASNGRPEHVPAIVEISKKLEISMNQDSLQLIRAFLQQYLSWCKTVPYVLVDSRERVDRYRRW